MSAKKKVKKIISLGVVKEGGNIVCSDLAALELVLGTRGVAGNLGVYGVKKEKGKYIVSINRIRERIEELERRKTRIEDYLEIMKRVVL